MKYAIITETQNGSEVTISGDDRRDIEKELVSMIRLGLTDLSQWRNFPAWIYTDKDEFVQVVKLTPIDSQNFIATDTAGRNYNAAFDDLFIGCPSSITVSRPPKPQKHRSVVKQNQTGQEPPTENEREQP